MTEKSYEIIKVVKNVLDKKFDNIEQVILFGSQLDDSKNKYSDYDILVILNSSYDWKLENDILDEVYKIDLKYDIVTDIKVIAKEELSQKKGKQPYIEEALYRGIVA